MFKTKIMAALLLVALCIPNGYVLAKPAPSSPKDPPQPPYETRVFIRDNCLIKPKPQGEFIAAIAAIFLPILIEKLLGGAAAALKKAGSDETLRDSAKLPTYLYQLSRSGAQNKLNLNPDLGCVIVVRGSFDKAGDPAPAGPSASVTALRNGGIQVRDIAMVYEGAVTIADDKTALRYEGRYFEVNGFLGSQSSKKSKTSERRAVVVSIAITGAGEKEGEPVLSLAMVNFGEVNAGTILGPDELKSKQSSWLGGLAISQASLKAVETMTLPNNNNPIGIMPVTVETMVAETSSGNAALKFIGEVLDSAKEDVAKTVSGEILNPKDKTAEAASALEKLLQEEESAYSELLSAEAAFAEFGPLEAGATPARRAAYEVKKFKVVTAGRAWCIKFEALGKFGHAPLNRGGHSCPLIVND